MTKITAKYITDNLPAMMRGHHITFRGAEYWVRNDLTADYREDLGNGTIYCISQDRKISGCINGCEYGKVISGVAYRI